MHQSGGANVYPSAHVYAGTYRDPKSGSGYAYPGANAHSPGDNCDADPGADADPEADSNAKAAS